ncbi:outer membrane beta-barrel protein [Rhizobium helianthi]|uniref:Outer membrane beta-barrel protein n=1 Tax=Rhizobium helianthi TaxID=1132695 RepID=A0ABW4M9M0_9HYPH
MTKTFAPVPPRLRPFAPLAALMASVCLVVAPTHAGAQSAEGNSFSSPTARASGSISRLSNTDPNTTALQDSDPSSPLGTAETPDSTATATNPHTGNLNGLRGSTGMLQATPMNQADNLAGDDLNTLTEPSENQPEQGIEPGEAPAGPRDDASGLRLGSFMLRTSSNQSLNTQKVSDGAGSRHRTFFASTMNGSLTSDWGRHALTITGASTFEKNISGQGATEPNARIDGDLRLDLSDQTIAHLTAGYAFEREETSNPNALAGATQQARVDRYSGGASIERELGVLRGTAAIAATRTTYGSVSFADGTRVDLGDRDRNAVQGRIRLGYELSPALIPFIEATLGRAVYDERLDASGFARSSWSYGGRAGVQLDLGEKLRGELGLGYATVDYEDARLASIDAFTIDGTLLWSPRRGTNVDLGLRTTVQDATTAGQSGWVEYLLSSGLSHELRSNLTARLTGSTTWRDFSASADQLNWAVGTGLVWNVNRYLDATANVGYELNDNPGGVDSKQWRAGIGLSLRR